MARGHAIIVERILDFQEQTQYHQISAVAPVVARCDYLTGQRIAELVASGREDEAWHLLAGADLDWQPAITALPRRTGSG